MYIIDFQYWKWICGTSTWWSLIEVVSRDTVVSRDEFTILYIASRNRTVYLYANRQVASTRDYRISITVEPMMFWLGAIDSLGSNCIIKVFSFFLYVPYERRYCDTKFESGNFLLRNVVIIIIVDPFYVVRLQHLTQEALVIKSGSDVDMYVSRSRMSKRENGRAESERENRSAESEWESEWENKQESEQYSAMLLSVRPNILPMHSTCI